MTDPKRLIDSEELGADLLASARTDGPSNRARARAAAALGVGVGIAAMTAGGTAAAGTSATAGAGATAAKVGGASLLAKIIGGTILVAAVGGGTAVAVRESSAPTVPTAVVATSSAPAPAPMPMPKIPVVVEESRSGPVVEANELPTAPLATTKPAPRPSATASHEGSLTRELGSLDAARALLGRGDASGALAALDRHDREFAHGSLRAESAMLRVEALLAKGDEAGAKARAKDLLARDPNGPHAKRLRTILER